MTQFVAQSAEEFGIIFIGEKNQLAGRVADELHRLGLYRFEVGLEGVFTLNLCKSLNAFRRSNCLPESDFADPVSLRLLLHETFSGDELLLLAGAAESRGSEIERFNFCERVLQKSAETGRSLVECIFMERTPIAKASAETAKSAVIAWLLVNGRASQSQ